MLEDAGFIMNFIMKKHILLLFNKNADTVLNYYFSLTTKNKPIKVIR